MISQSDSVDTVKPAPADWIAQEAGVAPIIEGAFPVVSDGSAQTKEIIAQLRARIIPLVPNIRALLPFSAQHISPEAVAEYADFISQMQAVRKAVQVNTPDTPVVSHAYSSASANNESFRAAA
jgi:hypothetical protein